jgi:hypothetical protein
MQTLQRILWPIAVTGALGASIDFLIGKASRQKAKNFLLKWWIRFDHVHSKNFGREEGLFAGRLIAKWFGRKIWGYRRIVTACGVFLVFLLPGYLRFAKSLPNSMPCYLCNALVPIFVRTEMLIIFIIGFCVLVSFTKFITYFMSGVCGVGALKNFTIFVTVLMLNYFIFLFSLPLLITGKNIIILFLWGLPSSLSFTQFNSILSSTCLAHYEHLLPNSLGPRYIEELLIHDNLSIDLWALYSLSLLPTLVRLLLSIVFVGSFLLHPFVVRPISPV